MALADLLQALEAEGAAHTAAATTAAASEAERILTEGRARSAGRLAARLGAREVERRAEASGQLEVARREAVATRLATEQAVLRRILERVRHRLTDAVSMVEAPAVARDVTAALGYLGDRPATVVCPRAWLPAVRALQADRADIQVGTSEEASGIRVLAADGSMEVDATLATRLERLWPRLAIELLRRLESGA